MDLDFGHGVLPRIGEENYKAVDHCIGPADLFAEPRMSGTHPLLAHTAGRRA
jgi:hypothetical protein